ncbi:MAG: PhzF family phenazine biosynthesis protein [Actinobacteria bacterium]|nr:MAG: PhzF family phenazine biosynthesis protein [Actinomycetota bacterium]
MRYCIVDVFTDRPLSGNALCVVVDACPERQMAAIAREVNLSETTFPTVTGEGGRVRRRRRSCSRRLTKLSGSRVPSRVHP